MIVTGVKCPYCKDEIYSQYRHDYRVCKCGKTFVDGGRDYLRYGCEEPETPTTVEIKTEEQ
jgi:hypothetical protein